MASGFGPLCRQDLRGSREVESQHADAGPYRPHAGFACGAEWQHAQTDVRSGRCYGSAEIEPAFAAAGHAVVSNSSAFRMAENVPLVIPEVNADHFELIKSQQWYKDNGGFMVTNPNCSAIGLGLALAPPHRRFGIDKIFVATMQAISGAGYPGVASMDILGNLIPYIANEEHKLEEETR